MKEEKAKKLRSKRRKWTKKEHLAEWYCTRLLVIGLICHFLSQEVSFIFYLSAFIARLIAGISHKRESSICHTLLKNKKSA